MLKLVGTLLSDRYLLEAKLGSGGMSTVYLAHDQRLQRPVAIKLMHREIAADDQHLERFRREARAVAQLSHPHIVGVIDVGEDDGRPYIVLEYVQGQTLKDRIREQGQLPVPEALAYAIEIARALDAAHQRGIVHRDVKPQNILIDQEGRAKVADFGIAQTLDDDQLTADGRVVGTTDYVSPEQALGHDVTGQSDLYSLGIVLYEMLVGEVPFKGESQVAVAMKHVRERVPDVQEHRPGVSAVTAAVVDRATDKDLHARYRSAQEMVADLEEALAVEASRAGETTGEATAVIRTLPEQTKRRLPLHLRRPWFVVASVLVLAALITAAAFALVGEGERGTGGGPTPPSTDLKAVSLSQNSARDYDPLGDESEHADESAAVVDGDLQTTWSTETYDGGVLPKAGVGIYVDAKPKVAAKVLEVRTPTPGWNAQIYGANGSSPPSTFPDSGWSLLATKDNVRRRQRFDLDTAGQPFRYYLVWITKLPPESSRVEISQIYLFR